MTVKNCKGLDDGDLVGKTDAYAYIEIDGCDPQQTKCISGTLNPEWNETRGPASIPPNHVASRSPLCGLTGSRSRSISRSAKN